MKVYYFPAFSRSGLNSTDVAVLSLQYTYLDITPMLLCKMLNISRKTCLRSRRRVLLDSKIATIGKSLVLDPKIIKEQGIKTAIILASLLVLIKPPIDIAKETGLPVNTVRDHYKKAMQLWIDS